MKTKLLFTILIALCLSLCLIFASCGSGGTNDGNGSQAVDEGLGYALSDDETCYTVTGIGNCQDKDIYIPSTYKGLPVTSIDNYAFDNCTSLTSVTIPNSITSIGSEAFKDCTSLTSVTIGESVTSIGNDAFSGCTSLTEINFNATEMADLTGHNNVFSNAGTNGNGITVNIGSNVTKIPNYLFYPYSKAPKITSVVFEENSACTSIGGAAFFNCTSLTSVTIGESVTSIGSSAFADCTSLTSITIPERVTSIGYSAFADCTSLTEINFNATKMADLYDRNCVFYNAGKNNNGITVNIGRNVTKIPSYLFCPYSEYTWYSPKITSVVFEENSVCTSIGNYAFV